MFEVRKNGEMSQMNALLRIVRRKTSVNRIGCDDVDTCVDLRGGTSCKCRATVR